MEVAGLCSVCGAPGAMHTCNLCARQVCARHFVHAAGTCTAHPPGDLQGGGAPPPHGVS